MKRLKFISCVLFIIIFTTFSATVFAENGIFVDNQDDLTQTEEKPIESIQDASNHETELEKSAAINQTLLGIYETWTSIISIILILVTILGIAAPIYANIRIDKKIKRATEKLRNENDKLMEKHISINNALMLTASTEYWSSNEILKDILKEDKENTYLQLLIGRNIFLQYTGDNSPKDLNEEQLQDVEEAINHYLFVANHSDTEEKYYTLGVIFPNSIIHELCILTEKLIDHSIKNGGSNYHKLTVSVIKAIERILAIKDFDDIANDDQTNVHIMSYIKLNKKLAESYAHFGNIKAKKQYLYTLKLYSISKDLDYKNEIEECTKALAEL